MRFIYLCLLCLLLALSSPVLAAEPPSLVEEAVTIAGTITKTGIAGNCYQLIAANGTKYELMGEFPHKDGLKVQITGTLPTNVMTLCQVGRPLRVNSIKKTSIFSSPWFKH
jgi:hypothetical protein